MNKQIMAAVAFSTGIVLASAALASSDPNCPSCSFSTGIINSYGVGQKCTWITLDTLPNHKFTVGAVVSTYSTMSAFLLDARLNGETVTIEYFASNLDGSCGSPGGTVILGVSH